MIVSLIGLPGCGKTTVGRLLGKRLGLPSVDADQRIEERLGCSIRDYFEREGEAAFRAVETMVLDELTQGADCVLSTGGGAVLAADNRRHLRTRSHVVYLHAQPWLLARRLRDDLQRPLLQGGALPERLQELARVREPLYRETAHMVVDTSSATPMLLVQRIAMQLEMSGLT